MRPMDNPMRRPGEHPATLEESSSSTADPRWNPRKPTEQADLPRFGHRVSIFPSQIEEIARLITAQTKGSRLRPTQVVSKNMYAFVKLLVLSTSYDGASMDEVPTSRVPIDSRRSVAVPPPFNTSMSGPPSGPPSGPAAAVDLTQIGAGASTEASRAGSGSVLTAEDPRSLLQSMIGEHSAAMFRLAKSIVRDSALAEDVVQESLMKAWQAAGSFRGDSSMRSWILRITQNTAISMLRKRREDFRDPVNVPEIPDLVGQTDRQAAGRAMVNDLWIALADLDQTSRTIVVLRELEGLTYEEISDVLDLPLPTIKTRLFRSRRTLASVLEEWR